MQSMIYFKKFSFLNSQGMSAEKQPPTLIVFGELTCTDLQRLLTQTDP